MLFSVRTLILFFTVVVHAGDLSCLWWGLIATPVAAYCYFANDDFKETENITIAAIEKEAENVKDAGVFLIKHHPVVLAYNYGKDVITNGTDKANQDLRLSIYEEGQAGIGFAKEAASIGLDLADRGVALTRFQFWNDGAQCVLDNMKIQIPQGTQKEKRASVLLDRFHSIDKNCFHTPGFETIAKWKYLNASNPSQKVGTTLADVAVLLVAVDTAPGAIRGIAGAGEVGGAAAEGTEAISAGNAASKFDLVLPGDTNGLRVIKNVEGKGASFDSEAEAAATRKKLEDEPWGEQNCASCEYPTPAIGALRVRRSNRLNRRVGGGPPTLCCNLPDADPAPEEDFDIPNVSEEQPLGNPRPLERYRPSDYAEIIEESSLIPPAEFTARDVVTETEAVLDDIDKLSTALTKWSPELTGIFDSKTMFSTVRNMFEKVDADSTALYDLMEVEESGGPGRLGATTDKFLEKVAQPANPTFDKLKQFSQQAMDDAWTTLKSLQKLADGDRAKYQQSIDYYYVKATKYADRNPDPRGLHQDGGDLALASADTPGLVIEDENEKLSRLKIFDDSHYIIKGMEYTGTVYDTGKVNEALWHTVFGPDIVKNGRVSMIVSISKKYPEYLLSRR